MDAPLSEISYEGLVGRVLQLLRRHDEASDLLSERLLGLRLEKHHYLVPALLNRLRAASAHQTNKIVIRY